MVVDLTRVLSEGAAGELPSHISASQISAFHRCAEAYRQTRILGVTSEPESNLTVGLGVHKGIETYYRSLGERITPGEREQRAMMAAGDYVDDTDPTAHDDADEAMRLVQTYIRDAPKITPVALEERIEVDLPGTSATLVGRLDCLAEDRIVDFKTSKSTVSKPAGDWKLQAWLYQAAHGLPAEWHVLVKTKEPKIVYGPDLRVPYDREKTRHALEFAAQTRKRIEHLYETLGPDQPWPTNGVLHMWACGKCPVRHSCPMGGDA